MPVARLGAVATLLPNGTVLVIGGGCSGADNIALLYTATTGRWSQAAGMNVPHLRPAAVLLRDGVVLVAGGGATGSGAAELYVDGQWRLTTRMNIDVQSVVGVLLGNGDVLVFGGYPLTSYVSEFYDPATATWTMTQGVGVISGPLTTLADGSAFITGGVTHYKSPSRNAYAFTGQPETVPNGSDTGTITIYPWTFGAAMNMFRAVHTATRLANGQVLVAGGFTSGATVATHLASITATAELYTP